LNVDVDVDGDEQRLRGSLPATHSLVAVNDYVNVNDEIELT
jgi:hypothetical protein